MPLQYRKAVSWSVKINEKPKPEVNLSNDVQVIRNILLGEHLEKFQKQVDALEKELSALRKENKALLKELEAAHENRFQDLISRLEQVKNEQGESSTVLRRDFDLQIKEVSKRSLAYEDKQGGLIASLANALLQYKDNSGK
jgi:predicted  nucleic acid-binding Zn-ribbon protein